DYRDLDLMRRIRNEAAHSPFDFSLEDEGVVSLVRQLTASARIPLPLPTTEQLTPEEIEEAAKIIPMQQPSDARVQFVDNALSLHAGLALMCIEKSQQVVDRLTKRLELLEGRKNPPSVGAGITY